MSEETTESSSPSHFIEASAKAIGDAVKLASTEPAIDYLHERFAALISKNVAMTSKYKDVLAEIANYATVIRLQSQVDTDPLWRGDTKAAVLTKFRTYQESRAKEAFKFLAGALPEGAVIDFDFAMNHAAELLQAFSMEGSPLLPKLADNLNLVFSDWLTSNHNICDNGVVYQSDETGTIKKNEAGEALIVDSEEYIARFTSEFPKFCEDHSQQITSKKLSVNVTQRAFPGDAPVVEMPHEVERTPEAAPVSKPSAEASPEADKPTSSTRPEG